MEVRKNNLSFKANIRFVSYEMLQQEVARNANKLVVESSTASKIVTSRKGNLFSCGISYCVSGVVKFTRNNYFSKIIDELKIRKKRGFHILPSEILKVGDGDQFKSFDSYIRGLKKQNSLKTFIIGGVAEDPFSKFLLSLRVIKFFNRKFTNFKKDVTIFFGQYSRNVIDNLDLPESSFLYLPQKNTILVNCRVIETTLSSDGGASRRWNDVLDIEGIKKHFQYIKISSNDTVYVRDKKVLPHLLEKN